MTQTFIKIEEALIEASTANAPEDRRFRAAWALDGEVIQVDMVKAREIQRDMLRKEREEEFARLDSEFMKALETGADTSAIAAEKQALRDLPGDARLESAETPEALSLLTMAYLLNN